jgi:CRISPR-associated protein Csb1
MPDQFIALRDAPRLLLEAGLKPAQGERFQPTGFADLGAAQYTTPAGVKMLLVESAQSVANRLERAAIDGDSVDVRPELAGLPYVRVELSGEGAGVATSSLVEAHRLNSPFISANKDFEKQFLERSGYRKGQLISWPKAAAAVLYFDPFALLHGVFFSNLEDGRLRFPRMLSGFIEASDVAEVASGGVKNNQFDPSGTIQADGYNKDVYGNVPYSRLEFTARHIRAYFNLDLAQLRGYRLPATANDLMIALALYKIRRFLDEGLRLRTACDFSVIEALTSTSPIGFSVPTASALKEVLPGLIAAARSEPGMLAPEIVRLTTKTVKGKKGKAAQADDAGDNG